MSDEAFRQTYADLSRCCGKWRSWYLLVDPTLSNLPAQFLSQTSPIPLPVSHPELRADLRPYLLPLGEPGRDLRVEATVKVAFAEAVRQGPENDGRRSLCGWIYSDLPAREIAVHLAGHASVVVTGKRRLFRIWDPRTLDLLALTLDVPQQRALVGPIGDLRWLGRSGEIRSFATAGERAADSLVLHQRQLQTLLYSEAIHQVLDVLQDLGRDASSEAVGRAVLDSVHRGAARWQLTGKADLVEFALHAILIGAAFDDDADVQPAMRKAAAEGRPAVQPLADFTEERWSQVRQRLGTGDNMEMSRRREVVEHG